MAIFIHSKPWHSIIKLVHIPVYKIDVHPAMFYRDDPIELYNHNKNKKGEQKKSGGVDIHTNLA